jgi:hypothetical protein
LPGRSEAGSNDNRRIHETVNGRWSVLAWPQKQSTLEYLPA